MTPEQLSALSDIVDASWQQLRILIDDLEDVGDGVITKESDVEDAQQVAERISEEAFNLVELLASAQEEDYD